MARKFRIGLARDFFTLRSEVRSDLGLRRLDNEMRRDLGLRRLDDEPRATCELFPQYLPEITPEQIAGYDVLILGGPSCTRHTVSGPELKLSIVARLGVGCDNVDLAALTERDILLTITPEGIRQPMATATVTFILALAHELFAMDRLVREGRWIEKLKVQRRSLTGRVVGIVGLGNIGAQVLRLLKPFDVVHLATDPFVKPDQVTDLRVELGPVNTNAMPRR